MTEALNDDLRAAAEALAEAAAQVTAAFSERRSGGDDRAGALADNTRALRSAAAALVDLPGALEKAFAGLAGGVRITY